MAGCLLDDPLPAPPPRGVICYLRVCCGLCCGLFCGMARLRERCEGPVRSPRQPLYATDNQKAPQPPPPPPSPFAFWLGADCGLCTVAFCMVHGHACCMLQRQRLQEDSAVNAVCCGDLASLLRPRPAGSCSLQLLQSWGYTLTRVTMTDVLAVPARPPG